MPIIGSLSLGTTKAQGESITRDFLLTFTFWALPGAILAAIGTKMAGEKILMTASTSA